MIDYCAMLIGTFLHTPVAIPRYKISTYLVYHDLAKMPKSFISILFYFSFLT